MEYQAKLVEFKAPTNESKLHSFLVLTNFLSRWISNLAQIAEPLWEKNHKKGILLLRHPMKARREN